MFTFYVRPYHFIIIISRIESSSPLTWLVFFYYYNVYYKVFGSEHIKLKIVQFAKLKCLVQVVSHGAPKRLVFLQKLLANAADSTNPVFEACVIEAIERFLPTIEPVLETLNALLIEFDIDPKLTSTALPQVLLPGTLAS